MSAATKQDIISWFETGVENKEDHMIVLCDQIDWYDFPIYTKGLEKFKEVYDKYSPKHSAIKIIEVYDLNMSMDEQMEEVRAFHYPEGFQEILTKGEGKKWET